MAEPADLLPCPFCGRGVSVTGKPAEAVGRWRLFGFRVSHAIGDCHVSLGETTDDSGDSAGMFDSAEEAIAAWNTRDQA